MTPAEEQVYAAIVQAADRGQPCPGNLQLARLIGAHSTSTAVRVMRRLQERGLIAVDVYSDRRRVTLLRSGKATACERATPHLCAGAARPGRPPSPQTLPPASRPEAIRAECAAEAASRAARLAEAMKLSGTIFLAAATARRDPAPARRAARRVAHGREPCPRCGTRGDIGCAHQRPDDPRDTRGAFHA